MQDIVTAFIEPRNATHRQYEALRAFFVDGIPQTEIAETFGYSVGAFRVMCCAFRKDPQREFFIQPRRGGQGADMIHELKTWSEYFEPIHRGIKRFL